MEMVQFFLPRAVWPADPLPTNADDPACASEGILTHTLQTYLRLKNAGYPCELIDELPREGLIVSHRDLIARAPFSPDLFLVNMLADRGPHAWAQAVVVQNPVQAERPFHTMIPQWPQPGLIPRDPAREDRFEVVAYVGRPSNLVPELRKKSWARRLRDLGLEWRIVGPPRTDYHDVDAVVAARDFKRPKYYDYKPAAKLVNAWLAGTIPLAAPEPAHVALRSSDLDYVSVASVGELYDALVVLKKDAKLRRALMDRGIQRGSDFTAERTTEAWQRFLDDIARPAYQAWCAKSRSSRWLYFGRRCLRWPLDYRKRHKVFKDWYR